MAGHYTYVVSALPMLHFGQKLPLSYAKFLEGCRGLISEEEISVLASLEGADWSAGAPADIPLLKAWKLFEVVLRNELVKLRSARKQTDAGRYLRHDGWWDSWVVQVALNAVRQPAPLEAEKILDEERWKKLDELSFGHYFDFEALLAYGLKLLILERWERVASADRTKILEETLVVN
ncbi:hypothetical protein BU251_08235 [Candidatus Velamenicoccus archaeovorus]|uniref:DUF2764 family protein n=1 Tax=Velamenicoccus archaeovorus TaxID=1930593 RepID=A0A410P695_VELA1|nr:DUF2764 family protein [Candidatus Velamenicoccus archaeovorus]QAT17707.1 hypothetical protein BU251_08235 [Candidatus Velamenicoccus archaeovorus]